MKDRLKFRCFGNEYACFLKGMHTIDSFEIHSDSKTASIYYDNGNFDGCAWLENVVIMQCTGLRDIDGKLIYEGDIVKASHRISKLDGVAQVYWSNDGAMFMGKSSLPFPLHTALNMQVIGNIYENPELLESVGYE
jgi:uncharacterized phage protein (TIGR01671 family)